jgi:hypothetical protein
MSKIIVRHHGYGIVYGSAALQRRRAAERELRRLEKSLPSATVRAAGTTPAATTHVAARAVPAR